MNEDDLESAVAELVEAWAAAGISAGRIPDLVEEIGAVRTVAKYSLGGETRGFLLVLERLGPDSTLEALVLDPDFQHLFYPEVITSAESKLN